MWLRRFHGSKKALAKVDYCDGMSIAARVFSAAQQSMGSKQIIDASVLDVNCGGQGDPIVN